MSTNWKKPEAMLPKPGEGQPKNRIVGAASVGALIFLVIFGLTQLGGPTVPMQTNQAVPTSAPALPTPQATPAPTVEQATAEPPAVEQPAFVPPPAPQRAEAPAAVVEEEEAPVEVVDLEPPVEEAAVYVAPLRDWPLTSCPSERDRCAPPPCTAEHGRCEAGKP